MSVTVRILAEPGDRSGRPARTRRGAERGLAAERLGLDELLAASDVVLALLPLTAGTRHLLGARALAAMRPGAFPVNVGRGSVVDEQAVAEAVADGRLGWGPPARSARFCRGDAPTTPSTNHRALAETSPATGRNWLVYIC